jgi:glyoxylase-like metal-dependent hydrolase (beta-lactamase superfamily II)/rhodanese-related sulfurtransferase
MKIEQIYTGCLAHGAYYIESNGEAAIIDPLREVQPYIEMAERRNAKIKFVFETHFHADFVSGHKDLAEKTGAAIVYGPTTMPTGYNKYVAYDGEIFPLGNAKIRLIHTPGHTLESSCYLLIDETGKETAIFTGDTLFIGDVGRPDLAQKVIAELTQEKLANHLFESLRNKIIPLNDDLIVYPGHGAGSACGKKMSKETFDTLGNQKKTNYALNLQLTRQEFIKELLNGLTPPPGYFPKNVLMNIQGYESVDKVIEKGMKKLNPDQFEWVANETGAIMLDTRQPNEFVKGFIPNSINIGLDGQFAGWVGTLIPDIKQEILIIATPGTEQEVVTRLARVGYDNAIGYLDGGFEVWKNQNREIDSISSITVDEFNTLGTVDVLDVRRNSEYRSEHLLEAENTPLDYINDSMAMINKNKKYFVHCAGGYRSVIFISVLKARGFENLVNIEGGFTAIKASGKRKISDYVCPNTEL